jgi:hypothetical protein
MRRKVKASRTGVIVVGLLLCMWGSFALLCVRVPEPEGPPAVTSRIPDPYPNTWPLPPPADVTRLLDGLGPGSTLTTRWRVRGVSPVLDKKIVVDVDDGAVGFRVWIMRPGNDQRLPPHKTEKYVLYTSQPRPTAEAVGDGAFGEVLKALGERLQKTENSVPTPAGL